MLQDCIGHTGVGAGKLPRGGVGRVDREREICNTNVDDELDEKSNSAISLELDAT